MKTTVLIASNKPDKVLKSLAWYKNFDRVVIYCNELDTPEFEAAFQESGIPLPEIWEHSIVPLFDGQAPLGAIRYYAMETLRRKMGKRDFGILADDDLGWVSFYSGKRLPNGAAQYEYPGIAGAKRFSEEVIKTAKIARENDFQYVANLLNGRAKNGFKPERPIRAVYSWSGFFGFFKNSYNPFDPKIGWGADQVAIFNAVKKFGLSVLRNDSLVIFYDMKTKRYRKNTGSRDAAIDIIVNRYPDLAMLVESQTGTNSKVRFVKLNPKMRNLFKQDVPVEFR